jgi:hypothetical protein
MRMNSTLVMVILAIRAWGRPAASPGVCVPRASAAALYPAFVVLVIVATGNHFFLDAAAGA